LSATKLNQAPTEAALRATFDAAPRYTVGLEEEVMLLDPDSFELAPVAQDVLQRVGDDDRFKLELPASQIEILTPARERVSEAMEALMRGREDLAERAQDMVRLASAGAHPFSSGLGQLNQLPQYEHTIREYGAVAKRQLVCALQVHVAVGDADRALAVYNAVRSYLPLIAALAANAPFYEGRDSGLASVRPKLGGLLPRQGVPPAIPSWEAYAETLAWGQASNTFVSARWWWELRLHPRHGTLEFRVPDGQATIADGAALAAVIQALVVWLSERHAGGERLPQTRGWRIDENRWSACRYGVQGTMVDPHGSDRRPTREHLHELLSALEPTASELGASRALAQARRLVEVNGAIAQRERAQDGGPVAAAGWLAERFLDPWVG
jgi:carboxylate-amine ligase